jgi:divalent metal cation (Fe/Co/Zn/Cd) transporter
MTVSFGGTELPSKQQQTLRRAIRLEWITIVFLVGAIILVGLVLGNSQAMKAAWVEDCLSLAPPIAFLVAVRMVRRAHRPEWPYGYHRSIGVAHLVAAVALTTMGTFLIVDSATVLITAEHPTIGTVELFGQVIWLGWLMIFAMVVTGIPPVILGHLKIKLARDLHDKVLYADADMNKADWMTALGSIIGVTGIGIGLWWLDAVAALFISGNILWDGIKNIRASITDLMDMRAATFDDKEPHPVIEKINSYLRDVDWVADAGSRVRDEGHVFHVEAFVVPRSESLSLEQVEATRLATSALDWRLQDVVIVPVRELPSVVRPD